MVSGEPTEDSFIPKPLRIWAQSTQPKIETPSNSDVQPLRISAPAPFPYKENKAVPWNYNCEVTAQDSDPNTVSKDASPEDEDTANITGVGGMTRSGRCYAPDTAERARKRKGKDKVVEDEEDVIVHPAMNIAKDPAQNPEKPGITITETTPALNPPTHIKRPVTEREACEFLKVIKHSEYSVVDQLNKTPSEDFTAFLAAQF